MFERVRARLVGPALRRHADGDFVRIAHEHGLVGAGCRLRAHAARSSPRSSPTSGSPSRSSSRSRSRDRRRCSRSRSTRSPTPATRACCSSAASAAARRPPSEHPFGFGTERYFWAFIVALVLFTLGSLFALYEGVEKLIDPHELDSPICAFAVLGVAIVLEGLSLRTAHREATPSRHGRSWWQFIRTTKSPELPVVLLEDTGALVGLLFALIGISLAEITGNAAVGRGRAASAIGLLLGVIAVVLAIEMKSLLIGEAVTPRVERRHPRGDPRRPRGEAHHPPPHPAPRPRRRAARGQARVRVATPSRRSRDAIDTVEARVRTSTPIVATDLLRTRSLRRRPAPNREEDTDDQTRPTTPSPRSTASTRRSTVTTSTR